MGWRDACPAVVFIAVLAGVFALIGVMASKQIKAHEAKFRAECHSPVLVNTRTVVSGANGYTSSTTYYIYRCADGKLRESRKLVQVTESPR